MLVPSSHKGSHQQKEVGRRFCTKALADDKVKETEATIDSKEDNLSRASVLESKVPKVKVLINVNVLFKSNVYNII